MPDATHVPPLFVYALRTVTESAARAAYDWIGRGDKGQGDQAARAAMRAELDALPIHGTVVVGEGKEGEVPTLFTGEILGQAGPEAPFDLAVDPVEGTSYLAKGMTNAMAAVAMAPRGSLYCPGPAFYMEKFVGPPDVKGKIDPDAPVADKLHILSHELDKPVSELVVYVLEKTRHRGLIDAVHRAGARVALYPAGDVAGAVLASIPGSGVDCLMGTGGCCEGVLSACAVRALGGEFLGRLDPQLPTEQRAVREAGLSTADWRRTEDLAASTKVYFCATGITTGLLLEGVERTPSYEKTQTLIISGLTSERQVLTTYHAR